MKLTIKTSNLFILGKCTGNCARIDFHRNGYIDITFNITDKFITVVDYCGVAVDNAIFWLNPNTKSILKNKLFLERFVYPLENSDKKQMILNSVQVF